LPVPARVRLVPLNLASPGQDSHAQRPLPLPTSTGGRTEQKKESEVAPVLSQKMAVLARILS